MTGTLITGATGFIGCRLAELRQSTGLDVRAAGLIRNDIERKRAESLRKAGVDLLTEPLESDAELDAALDGVDTVIHLAAAQHEANVPEEYFHRVNVDATRQLLERCELKGVSKFFYASSIGVYGTANGKEIDERTKPHPDNHYGRSKLAAEEMLAEHGGNTSIYIGRIGETYGPWDLRLHKLFAGIQRGRFYLVGPSRNLHQPIYVDDLSAAIDSMLLTPAAVRQPMVLCGEKPISTREMCECIAASLNGALPSWHIPMWPLLATAIGMEMTLGKVGIQPPLHRRRLDFFRKSLSFSTGKAESILSAPLKTTFREGAALTLAWYKAQGWL
jgi:nucleoside-diphosphate-sugar epimerase